MKKLALFLLALVPAAMWGYNFNYRIENNEAIVTRTPDAKGVVEIPSKIEVKGVKYPVTAIDDSAFYFCYYMTDVKLPKSIERIGDLAFFGTSIQEPVYTKTVFAYLPESFEGEYKMPKNITTITGGAFMGCGGLTSVVLPKNLVHIGDLAFWGSSVNHPVYSQTEFVYMPSTFKGSYTVPEGITRIADKAFIDCRELETVILPNSVKSISKMAFLQCGKLISVQLPAELNEIGDSAFFECKWLYKIDFSSCKIKKIGKGAFYSCAALQKVIFAEGLTSIGDGAFAHCYDIDEVKLPASLEEIGILTFDRTKKVTTPIYSTKIFVRMPEDATGTYEIPEGIEKIAPMAFRFCQKLTSVKIPSSVKEIGDKAFEYTKIEVIKTDL